MRTDDDGHAEEIYLCAENQAASTEKSKLADQEHSSGSSQSHSRGDYIQIWLPYCAEGVYKSAACLPCRYAYYTGLHMTEV